MTKLQRRKLYWTMYVTAVGISELMTAKEVVWSLEYDPPANDFPIGICGLFKRISANVDIIDLPELLNLEPRRLYGQFWFPPGDWKPRAEILLKAYKSTF